MPIEMGLWRIDGMKPVRLSVGALPSEETLESFLERDPTLLGETLLIIGRQARTPYGKFIDLVAIDIDGNMHVLELKRDRTPREVVAQVLDYATWVTTLTHEAITDMASDHLGEPLEVAFQSTFGEPLPDEINADIRLTVVASSLDNSSERIIGYLREFGVPINAVFFSYLEDGERKYLARSWLASDLESKPQLTPTAGRGKRADWNGRDWYASFGEGPGGRSWDDGRRFGFVSAGGQVLFSNASQCAAGSAGQRLHSAGGIRWDRRRHRAGATFRRGDDHRQWHTGSPRQTGVERPVQLARRRGACLR